MTAITTKDDRSFERQEIARVAKRGCHDVMAQ
jgi:hypothetical protein